MSVQVTSTRVLASATPPTFARTSSGRSRLAEPLISGVKVTFSKLGRDVAGRQRDAQVEGACAVDDRHIKNAQPGGGVEVVDGRGDLRPQRGLADEEPVQAATSRPEAAPSITPLVFSFSSRMPRPAPATELLMASTLKAPPMVTELSCTSRSRWPAVSIVTWTLPVGCRFDGGRDLAHRLLILEVDEERRAVGQRELQVRSRRVKRDSRSIVERPTRASPH